MDTTIYSDGTYLRNNPDWHADDSAWKAAHIARLIARHSLAPRSVVEIGCGSGEVLIELSKRIPEGAQFTGFDISPNAYTLCSRKAAEHLEFQLGDLLETDRTFDLALAVDVFEHVEDCFGFVRKLRERAKHKIYHIPLDLSVQSLARPGKLLSMRRSAGHIHYFSRESALALLKESGLAIVDDFYTAWAIDQSYKTMKKRLAAWPRRIAYALAPDATVRLVGGWSLMVLART